MARGDSKAGHWWSFLSLLWTQDLKQPTLLKECILLYFVYFAWSSPDTTKWMAHNPCIGKLSRNDPFRLLSAAHQPNMGHGAVRVVGNSSSWKPVKPEWPAPFCRWKKWGWGEVTSPTGTRSRYKTALKPRQPDLWGQALGESCAARRSCWLRGDKGGRCAAGWMLSALGTDPGKSAGSFAPLGRMLWPGGLRMWAVRRVKLFSQSCPGRGWPQRSMTRGTAPVALVPWSPVSCPPAHLPWGLRWERERERAQKSGWFTAAAGGLIILTSGIIFSKKKVDPFPLVNTCYVQEPGLGTGGVNTEVEATVEIQDPEISG